MIKFSRTSNTSDGYDDMTVEMSISRDEELTWVELQERFTNFLRACGYVIPYDMGDL